MFKKLGVTLVVMLTLFCVFQKETLAQNKSFETLSTDNKDVIFITGNVKDADNGQSLSNNELNFLEKGAAIVYANLNESGEYAIAIMKNNIKKSTDLVIKIDGYKDFTIDNIGSFSGFVETDILLKEDQVATAKISPKMNDSTSNPFIMQF